MQKQTSLSLFLCLFVTDTQTQTQTQTHRHTHTHRHRHTHTHVKIASEHYGLHKSQYKELSYHRVRALAQGDPIGTCWTGHGSQPIVIISCHWLAVFHEMVSGHIKAGEKIWLLWARIPLGCGALGIWPLTLWTREAEIPGLITNNKPRKTEKSGQP